MSISKSNVVMLRESVAMAERLEGPPLLIISLLKALVDSLENALEAEKAKANAALSAHAETRGWFDATSAKSQPSD
jgi:hypothetical protein